MKKLIRIVALPVGLLLSGTTGALTGPEYPTEAVASVQTYSPGKHFYVALRGRIEEGMHAYYRNPGSVGESVTASIRLPEGFVAEGPFWEIPHKMLTTGGSVVAYGYEKEVVAVWRVQVPADAPETLQVQLQGSAQMCTDEGCMPPTDGQVTLDLQKGDGEQNPAWKGIFAKVEELGDTPVDNLKAVRAADGTVVLSFRRRGEEQSVYFFSDDNSVHPAAAQKLSRRGDEWQLCLSPNDGKDDLYPAPEKRGTSISGNLSFADGSHTRVKNLKVSVAKSASRAGGGVMSVPQNFWGIMGALFLGGVILNLMPCVFPVLGLKVMSFVELSGGSRSKVVAHSLAFTLGIFVSFWVLAVMLILVSNAHVLGSVSWHEWGSILLGNDEGGANRSWAAWMQNQWVVYALCILLLVLGLWMYGVFEFGTRATSIGGVPQQRGGMTGSFMQGLLITVVATPCSGPFLGAAMAPALALPGIWMVVVFSGMAFGLALPYIVLGIFPKLLSCLPRPGSWMESLRQGFAFCMLAAAAWLLSVFLAFRDDTTKVILGLVIIAAACWVYGRWCPIYRSRVSRLVGLATALLLAAVGTAMPLLFNDRVAWHEWSPESVRKALEEGRPVYVDFTAKWCATCQANKQLAYPEEVYKVFADYDVLLLRADKTKPNETIDTELRHLNRNAVPTNALYLPGAEPVVTRELLTPSYLKEFLESNLKKIRK